MDLRDYLTLLETARETQKNGFLCFQINADGSGKICEGLYDKKVADFRSPEGLEKELIRLGTPPKPATVTITLPFDSAEYYATRDQAPLVGHKLREACQAAIAPYMPPK